MEDLFNMLSSSARLNKSKRKKKPSSAIQAKTQIPASSDDDDGGDRSGSDNGSDSNSAESRDGRRHRREKRPRKRHSAAKLAQIRREEVAAFRRRMGIRLSADNRREVALGAVADPVASFADWECPPWWRGGESRPKSDGKDAATAQFAGIRRAVLRNIEEGRWTEPTPIQMQAVPSLMDRKDVMGCAPTGSGKTGAFVLPLIALSRCSEEVYYGRNGSAGSKGDAGIDDGGKKKRGKRTSKQWDGSKQGTDGKPNLQGHIRSVLLAPTTVLASQLHREVRRLSSDLPGGFRCELLSKSNAGLAASQRLGGRAGVDCLVATPLRLAECLGRGMELRGVRLVVLDEADRLLDVRDGGRGSRSERRGEEGKRKETESDGAHSDPGYGSEDEEDSTVNESEGETDRRKKRGERHPPPPSKKKSGFAPSRTFLQQIDAILAHVPPSASRALFSATLGPAVRHLSESILRSPLDITTGKLGGTGGHSAAGGASDTIKQELKFVGREEGKLLAIRQLVAEGLTPPVLVFLQSKERAQALLGELLYDGLRVDLIHSGRSPAQRDLAVQRFRRGETWILLCTDLVARGVDFRGVRLVINYDLPADSVTYVHRIGRTGRAGREGRAVTLFTEGDFGKLRTIANIVRLSGCEVPEWMLTLKKRSGARKRRGKGGQRKRGGDDIDTTPRYDKERGRKEIRRRKQH